MCIQIPESKAVLPSLLNLVIFLSFLCMFVELLSQSESQVHNTQDEISILDERTENQIYCEEQKGCFI